MSYELLFKAALKNVPVYFTRLSIVEALLVVSALLHANTQPKTTPLEEESALIFGPTMSPGHLISQKGCAKCDTAGTRPIRFPRALSAIGFTYRRSYRCFNPPCTSLRSSRNSCVFVRAVAIPRMGLAITNIYSIGCREFITSLVSLILSHTL
jgi:hypothetical protein